MRILCVFIITLALLPAVARAQRGPSSGPVAALEAPAFRATYDALGVAGLANPQDALHGQVVARGGHLGVFARYRTDNGNWSDMPASSAALHPADDGKTLTYTSGSANALKVTQTFKLEGAALDWTIDAENTGTAPLEVGDLAIVFPWNRPGNSEDPRVVFEQGFTKHQFIEGAGSFIYFVRASGVGPYLMLTVKPGTKLEYTGTAGGGGGGRGGPVGGGGGGAWAAFIHSAATAGAETRGTWRQPNTSLKLGPAGTPDAKATYGFRMQWAATYDGLRDVLFKEGLLDIRIVPGMTLPSDLTAKLALHTQAKIEGIDPEFPEQTKVTNLGDAQPGYHIYELQFRRLGENLLTIRHDSGRKTYLEFFSTEPLETLIKKRSAFISFHQQWRDPNKWYNGLFSVYDMKNKILRSPEDTDGWTGRMGYVLACDDTALGKAPYVAEKNAHFPVAAEIETVEYYLKNFVWGGLQRTDKETPYPYGVYGIPNWKIQRDPEAKRNFEINDNRRPDLAEKMRVWRSYDYPHMTILYFHMYQIAKMYPSMVHYLDAAGYLERAYQTAHAYFTYPYELLPNYYETYKWGCYNELVILNLADVLDREGQPDRAAWLRAEWEKKVKYFVYDDPYPFRSEYAFDRTAFESTYALAKYGATHDMKPDQNLWHDIKLNKDWSHPVVKVEDSRAFMDRQLYAGLAVRGWLENAYYLLGADFTGSSDRGAMSYMAQMGGWGILDYGVNFADRPADWLQLGYASYLSAWALMNTGPAETNYGFWFPGKENDGATGWTFMTAKYGQGWYGKQDPRGPWHYDGEIDLGYSGALRSSATVLTRDPIFGWLAYGGTLAAQGQALSVVPRDGLRQRFYAVLPDARNPDAPVRRLKFELDRDGFAEGQPVVTDVALQNVTFTLENRTADEHTTSLWLSRPTGSAYIVVQDGQPVFQVTTGNWDFPTRADLKVGKTPSRIEIVRVQ